MTNCNCRTRFDCTLLAIAASVIIGLVSAILSFIGFVILGIIFSWVAFGIAAVYLAILLIISAVNRNQNNKCLCSAVPISIVGILLTLLASVILIVTSITATSVIGAIIVGAIFGGLTLIFTSASCLVKCMVNC